MDKEGKAKGIPHLSFLWEALNDYKCGHMKLCCCQNLCVAYTNFFISGTRQLIKFWQQQCLDVESCGTTSTLGRFTRAILTTEIAIFIDTSQGINQTNMTGKW